MRRLLWLICAVILTAAPAGAAYARDAVALAGLWRFERGDVAGAEHPTFDDSAWQDIRLPHTWNGVDGEDGGGEYYRGPGWYRVRFERPSESAPLWLEFDGAALATDVWVNGVHVGRHEGGYARFRFDISDASRIGENVLAVRVDNSALPHVAPLGGDFTIFGGLYRQVRLISVDEVHFDLGDYGGPGVYMTAESVSARSAQLHFVARLANSSLRRQRLRARISLRDADGAVAARVEASVRLDAGGRGEVQADTLLETPRLWRGRADPHLYMMTAELLDARGRVRDRIETRTGIRDAAFSAERGFFLNGEAYPLYGVNYQLGGRPGRGVAVRDSEIDQDFMLMDELGARAIRFAHMQHGPRAYELADMLGFAVWTEAPLVAVAADSDAFRRNLTQQMRELIRQTMNHPSVVVWGLGNEVYAADEPVNAAIALMQDIARAEDPSRATVYAHCCQDDLHRIALNADLGAYNRYFGWYADEMARIGAWADDLHARAPERAISVSEYGAGASVLHQQNPPERPRPDGPWHPEQYQTAFHETYWRALRDRPYLWGAFVWVAFDFASDGRSEGDRPGINDKGLITYDRAVRKDAYFWYQANWSQRPMAHIVNGRLANVARTTSVRAYSNQNSLTLLVNDRAVGDARVVDHVAVWEDVVLSPGMNRIEVRAPGGTSDAIVLRAD